MSYLEEKFIGLISARLDRFRKVGPGLYNFRCPLCNDSAKNKNKARGYLFESKGSYRFHCHNCGADQGFTWFLRGIDNQLYRDYSFESFRGSKPRLRAGPVQARETENNNNEKRLLDELLPRLDTLPPNHPAILYLDKRKMPKWAFGHMYFIEHVADIHKISARYKGKITSDEPRIVIPAYSRDHTLAGVTCRAILPDARTRYITISVAPGKPIIFGLDRIDPNKRIYVTEGPLDSFFLDNCIAVGTCFLAARAGPYIDKLRDVLVFDNQPRNAEVVQQMKRSLDDGHNVVAWPPRLEEKDLNDMVLAGHDVGRLVEENVKSGLAGLQAWSQWRKV